jgi:hypothetical protein
LLPALSPCACPSSIASNHRDILGFKTASSYDRRILTTVALRCKQKNGVDAKKVGVFPDRATSSPCVKEVYVNPTKMAPL